MLKKTHNADTGSTRKNRPARVLQMEGCVYLFFLKFVVDKSKNEMPNNKYGIAVVVFFSIKFTIDTIKKHIEASKKHIHLIFFFFIISHLHNFIFVYQVIPFGQYQ